MSQICDISIRVKHGGVLCPILYSVYVDKLIIILSGSKIGCTIIYTQLYRDNVIDVVNE